MIRRIRANRGLPAPITRVKPWRAIVLAGDDLGRITSRFCGTSARTWELIAANVGEIPLILYPGCDVAMPTLLIEGQPLFVPESWPDPTNLGTVGAGEPVNLADAWAPTIQSIWEMLMPGRALPAGVTYSGVANMLLGWWQHLPVSLPSMTKLSAALAGDQALKDYVGALLRSAAQFLEVTGASPAAAARIPWSAVPWTLVPWAAIRQAFPDSSQQAEFWRWFGMLSGGGAPPSSSSTREPLMDAGMRSSAGLAPVPVQQSHSQMTAQLSAGPGDGIDFAVVDWSSPKGFLGTNPSDIPWMIDWGMTLWGVFQDAQILQCASANPGRLQEMWACKDCYANVATFKARLCDVSLDACFCHAAPPPPVEQPPGPPQPPAPQPAEPSVPNWGCQTFPDCLGAAGNWPSSWPKPCDPFPGCVPAWLRQQNLPVPGEKAPPPEGANKPVSDTTIWWVIGGTIAVAAAGAAAAAAMRSRQT